MFIKPGTAPGHVIMVRDARQLLPDIEASLTEHGLDVELADNVAKLMNAFGGGVESTVQWLRDVLVSFGGDATFYAIYGTEEEGNGVVSAARALQEGWMG